MLKILANDGIELGAAVKLREDGYEVIENHFEAEELLEEIKNIDVLVVRSTTKVRKDLIDRAVEGGRLKLVVRGGVGIDNIDAEYARKNGIRVENTPNASSISVAELTIGHMLAVSRYINIANVTMRQGKWEKKKYEGVELYNKTLGLIGFGRIAKEVAKRAHAFGMKVVYTDICGKSPEYNDYEFCEKEELLKKSDFVSLHIPFIKEQGYVIGKNEIEIMKDGAYIINCARGGTVDEAALLAALNSGKLSGAALDVFEEEPAKNEGLVNHPKVSVTPHIGAATEDAQEKIGTEIVGIIENF